MIRWRAAALLVVGWLSWPPAPISAQQANNAACRALFTERFTALPENANACQALALGLVARLTTDFWTEARGDTAMDDVVGAGDLQPVSTGPASAAGSVAQGEAVPSGQPLALGGGSISAVGSDAGADAITALSVNPTTFMGGGPESTARSSRLSDLTVFFPVDNLDRDDDGDIDYFGFRVRINFTGLAAGSTVYRAAAADFEGLLARETEAAGRLLDRLGSMTGSRMAECVDAILAGLGPPGVESACGAGIATPTEEDYAAFRERLDAVRAEVDSRYFGLDLRMDFGDPTLGVVPNAEATALNAGITVGKQLLGASADALAPSTGVRARAGVRYTDLRNLDETSFAFDGALGLVLKRPVTVDQALTISGGFEFRFGATDELLEGAFQSDYISLRAGLSVPVSGVTDITVGFAYPLVGDEISKALSVSGNWKLLLPGLLPSGS